MGGAGTETGGFCMHEWAKRAERVFIESKRYGKEGIRVDLVNTFGVVVGKLLLLL